MGWLWIGQLLVVSWVCGKNEFRCSNVPESDMVVFLVYASAAFEYEGLPKVFSIYIKKKE